MEIARVAALRSEDPFYQVGAVALNHEGRILGTAYNGLVRELDMPEVFWDNKELRKPYIVHAEQNLCALLRRGEAHTVAVTLEPCNDCLRLLAAHGVRRVLYGEPHVRTTPSAGDLAKFFSVDFILQPVQR